MKFAFLFGFNFILPVACLHLTARSGLHCRAAVAVRQVIAYLLDMSVVILFSGEKGQSVLDVRFGP